MKHGKAHIEQHEAQHDKQGLNRHYAVRSVCAMGGPMRTDRFAVQPASGDKQKPTRVSCLLCQGEYCAGQGYSRHFDKRHRRFDFEEPFPCPACQRGSMGDGNSTLIDCVDAWMSHTESVHNIDGQRGHSTDAGMLPRLQAQPNDSSPHAADEAAHMATHTKCLGPSDSSSPEDMDPLTASTELIASQIRWSRTSSYE